MTSVVQVSEVHHLPYAHQHQHLPSRESRTPYLPHQTQPTPQSHPAVTSPSHAAESSATSMDTPMTDATPASRQSGADSPHSRSSHGATPAEASASSATSAGLAPPQQPSASSGLKNRRGQMEQPPPSPRFKPQSQPTSRASDPSQARVVPSSTAAPTSHAPTPHLAPTASAAASPAKVKVKSLSHIQSFVLDDQNPLSQAGARLARRDSPDIAPQYEISEMPVSDIIEMVAGLLTKITTTNDKQHQHLHRQIPPPDSAANLNPQTTSVLAFHGKNVPSISILSYLSRIHKYCPTTYEVFLSLLVYFDRMTERVNSGPLQVLREQSSQHSDDEMKHDGSRHSSVSTAALARDSPEAAHKSQSDASGATTPPPSGAQGRRADAAPREQHNGPTSSPVASDSAADEPYNFSHFFVVDSFNIHRLVIAGVTCASKFFSDIFYTNSRYAKVGGLPLPELNHLELQFLLLNDFRLAVPLEEMEAYGTMLVEFYAREVLANQHPSPASSHAAS